MKKDIKTPMSEEEKENTVYSIEMLNRLAKYKLNASHKHFLNHIMTMVPEDKREETLCGYIESLIGQAVMDYDNVHFRKRPDIRAWS